MSLTRRRGLGDVLHYFIPEEEQVAARARARDAPASTPVRWALLSDPLRPLDRSLATDLAAGKGLVLVAVLLGKGDDDAAQAYSSSLARRAEEFSNPYSPPEGMRRMGNCSTVATG